MIEWHCSKFGRERTSCMLLRGAGGAVQSVEIRFTVGLPAQGRNIMGQWAYGE
jgi:hypothetical protein